MRSSFFYKKLSDEKKSKNQTQASFEALSDEQKVENQEQSFGEGFCNVQGLENPKNAISEALFDAAKVGAFKKFLDLLRNGANLFSRNTENKTVLQVVEENLKNKRVSIQYKIILGLIKKHLFEKMLTLTLESDDKNLINFKTHLDLTKEFFAPIYPFLLCEQKKNSKTLISWCKSKSKCLEILIREVAEFYRNEIKISIHFEDMMMLALKLNSIACIKSLMGVREIYYRLNFNYSPLKEGQVLSFSLEQKDTVALCLLLKGGYFFLTKGNNPICISEKDPSNEIVTLFKSTGMLDKELDSILRLFVLATKRILLYRYLNFDESLYALNPGPSGVANAKLVELLNEFEQELHLVQLFFQSPDGIIFSDVVKLPPFVVASDQDESNSQRSSLLQNQSPVFRRRDSTPEERSPILVPPKDKGEASENSSESDKSFEYH